MAENNLIVISAPMGAKGHQIGRLLASCDNVQWYNHSANGTEPWKPYRENHLHGTDNNFTIYHWNRRFNGSKGHGLDEYTVPPVLDMANRQTQRTGKYEPINDWKQRVSPSNLMYALHGPLDKTKEFFGPAKHIVVIPKDMSRLLARFCQTSAKYYVDPENPDKTFFDLYEGNYMNMLEHLERVVDNYSRNVTEEDVIITDPDKFFVEENFQKVCDKFNLTFNDDNFDKVIKFIRNPWLL
jgi:hypothetical protein